MTRSATFGLLALSHFLSACTTEASRTHERGALPPGVAARVGEDLVSIETLRRIADAEHVSLAEARERAIVDALFAQAARADATFGGGSEGAVRGVLARALLDGIAARARTTPPTDAELDALVHERWVAFDRPVSVRTTHAVARVKVPADRPRALAVARTLAANLAGVTDPAEFVRRARLQSSPELEVRAERLPPVTPDGHTFDPNAPADKTSESLGELDQTFTRAAHALSAPGAQSPLVETQFGFHLILLEERLPERRPARDELRSVLRDDVFARRAKAALRDLVTRLRSSTPIEPARDADDLTALVPVTP